MHHFLKETDFTAAQAAEILNLARRLKQERGNPTPKVLEGQSWGLLFFKTSTRTQLSFNVALHELGAHPVFIDARTTQMGRGESIADTARIMSRYLHGLVIRCYGHEMLEEFVEYGSVPIVNALTDFLHPCQIYTDAFSAAERWAGESGDCFEALRGKTIAYVGDCASNMANSWILGASLFGMNLRLAGPKGYHPESEIDALLEKEGRSKDYVVTTDPREAVEGADLIYTDVWVSMGDEEEKEARMKALSPYQVNKQLLDLASPEALFQHCLPAHPGEEVTQEVLDDPRSIIWDQAENRLHTQKAILAALVGK